MSLKLMDLTTENNCLYMNNERHILISSSAFGELRKDLINNIGLERMKGFLLRYGWELGQKDAQKIKNENIQDIRERVFLGPMLHTRKGHVYADDVHVQIDESNNNAFVQMSGVWRLSYEAEEHIKLFGVADYEVCFTLVGYASGYISKLFDEMVIFKELTCKGKGDEHCEWLGKPVDSWNDKGASFLKYFREQPIIRELEETYDKLLHERNNLEKTAQIQKKLTEEIIKGNDLQVIADVVEETLQTPLLIEDTSFRPIAYSNSLESRYYNFKETLSEHLESKGNRNSNTKHSRIATIKQTTLFKLADHERLITPFYLQGKVYGYCSLVYPCGTKYMEVAEAIIDRISSVCSLYLLNEKAKFDTLERMKGKFLEELINDQYESKNEIIQRGNYLQLNLEHPYYMSVLSYTIFSESILDKLDSHKDIMEEIAEFCQNRGVNILVGQRTKTNNIDMLIPLEKIDPDKVIYLVKDIVKHLRSVFPTARFSAGISMYGENINNVAELFQQAESASRLASYKGDIVTFESIGIVGSLINENNVDLIEKSAEYELKPLYSSKEEPCHETLKTLYFFLANGGNLEQTAFDLSLSVSGLRYRIRRIEDKLSKNLRNPIDNYQLLLSLQSLLIIGKLNW